MKLLGLRLHDNGNDSIGILYYHDHFKDVKYEYMLEDEYRDKKIRGETRIPEGFYDIKLRKYGKFYDKYCKSSIEAIRSFTQKWGVMEIAGVRNFDDILIHCGNKESHTDGCLLVGEAVNNNSVVPGFVSGSMNAYARLVTSMGYWLDNGDSLRIEIRDFDREIVRML